MWKALASDYERLMSAEVALKVCPECGLNPFVPFLRGQVRAGVVRSWSEDLKSSIHKRLPRVFAVICCKCKEVVAYENINGESTLKKKYRKH